MHSFAEHDWAIWNVSFHLVQRNGPGTYNDSIDLLVSKHIQHFEFLIQIVAGLTEHELVIAIQCSMSNTFDHLGEIRVIDLRQDDTDRSGCAFN
ncbi:hypothetical protein D1872_216110 [compost metagenome]